MADIGATLREARMRQRIDISELEAKTKIRAKYLRALENEEWDLLPGATFVKSFLRTYAEALGLDARAVIEEYKLRHERLSEHELLPIAPPSGRSDRRRRGPPSGLRRDVAVAVLVVALVGLLIVLGRQNGQGDNTRTQAADPTATNSTRTTPARQRKRRGQHGSSARAGHALARLRLVPSGPVWVCLQAAGKRTLITGHIVAPGSPLPVYRSKQFKMTFGNGNLVMRINGRTLPVPDVQNAISYTVDHRGHRKTLPAGQGPTCA
jgi:transcriptional regulator with XRE-family HTH domain